MRRWTGLLFAALAGFGCGGGYDESSEIAEQSSEIINGSADLSTNPYERLRTVEVFVPLGRCSGTVLRPNFVLTAKHCIHSNGSLGGNPLPANQIRVNGIQGSAMYVGDFFVDAAVVMFASNVVSQWENFTAIDPFPVTHYLGQALKITGYGFDENGVAGTLKIARGTPQRVNQSYNPTTGGSGIGTVVSNPTTGATTAGGDSGGPLWGHATHPPSVAGVDSAGFGIAFSESYYAQAADFRYQFRYWIHDRTNASISVSFNSITDLTNNFDALQAISGTAPQWTVQNGSLVQLANAPQAFQIQRGIFENFMVQMSVLSGDDDTLGIAFRYVDKNNHYRCEANRASHVLRLVRRRFGFEDVLASTTWNGIFNESMVASGIEKEFECAIGNTFVTATNPSFPIGRVAIYNDFNKGARIPWYVSLQLPPSNTTW